MGANNICVYTQNGVFSATLANCLPVVACNPDGTRRLLDDHQRAYSMAMKEGDPSALLAEMKRTATLLRDARSVLRRVDTLAKTASAADDPSLPVIAEVQSATERLVTLLGRRQQTGQRTAKQAARRVR